MEVIASDHKQCDTGKYQDSDKDYRISFLAGRNSPEPRHLRRRAETLYAQARVAVCSASGNRLLSCSFAGLRTFGCE